MLRICRISDRFLAYGLSQDTVENVFWTCSAGRSNRLHLRQDFVWAPRRAQGWDFGSNRIGLAGCPRRRHPDRIEHGEQTYAWRKYGLLAGPTGPRRRRPGALPRASTGGERLPPAL